MPTMPFTKSHEVSTRHDSVYDITSVQRPGTPTPASFWYTIFVGATDRAKTVETAEYLLGHVWPGKDASAILEVVGNPAKRLREDEHTELRETLGILLYPGHNAIC